MGRMRWQWGIAGWMLLGLAACDRKPVEEGAAQPDPAAELAEAGDLSGPELFARVCSACHGPAGEGKEELFAPSIAGLPVWYVEEQLGKFHSGARGSHPEDLPGQQMRAISLALTGSQISGIAAAVSELPLPAVEPPSPGFDLERGRYRYANECMECHRYNGKGEIAFRSAPLVGLNRSYLRRQLQNYRSGLRGAVEGDLYGAKMVEIAGRLDDDEIELFLDYIGALANGDDPRSAREK